MVPPEKVAPPEFCRAVREALERTMLRRYGRQGLAEERWSNVNDIQRFMLWEDPIFEKLSYNPAGLGLAEMAARHGLRAQPVRGVGERSGRSAYRRAQRLSRSRLGRAAGAGQQLQHALHAHRLHVGRRGDLVRTRQPQVAAPSHAGRFEVLGGSRRRCRSACRFYGDLGKPHLARLLRQEDARLANDVAVANTCAADGKTEEGVSGNCDAASVGS